jgi:hypothetical protein
MVENCASKQQQKNNKPNIKTTQIKKQANPKQTEIWLGKLH